ncbi:MAG: hypothetical protein IKI69_05620 [Oscillospiraceae bacterium]|nr:hypothetical protein [Oscillospiraceae bacterium]
MENNKRVLKGGVRRKIISVLLVTIVLVIAAFTAIFLFQSRRVEQLVDDTYKAQEYVDQIHGHGSRYESLREDAVAAFHREMFHARNILFLLVVFIVAAGMASAYIGSTFMPMVFGHLQQRVGIAVMPLYLLLFAVVNLAVLELAYRRIARKSRKT